MHQELDAFDRAITRCSRTSLAGLEMFFDPPELVDTAPAVLLDFTVNAYFMAYARFDEYVFGVDKKNYCLHDMPQARFVLTSSRETFLGLFHSPERAKQLPGWVSGYVNLRRGTHVQQFNPATYTPASKFTSESFNGTVHEFTHIILARILGIPLEALDDLNPPWLNEVFTIWHNQRQTATWLRDTMITRQINPILASITQRGIFAHDQSKPQHNVAYQYIAHCGHALAQTLKAHPSELLLYPNDPPLFALCKAIRNAHHKSITVTEYLESLGVDMDQVETSMRQRYNLPDITQN